MITQRIRCECSDLFTCVPKPARRVLRHLIDVGASSLNAHLKAKKTENKNEGFDILHIILLIHVYALAEKRQV